MGGYSCSLCGSAKGKAYKVRISLTRTEIICDRCYEITWNHKTPWKKHKWLALTGLE